MSIMDKNQGLSYPLVIRPRSTLDMYYITCSSSYSLLFHYPFHPFVWVGCWSALHRFLELSLPRLPLPLRPSSFYYCSYSTFPFLPCRCSRNTTISHSPKLWQSQARYGDGRQNDAVLVFWNEQRRPHTMEVGNIASFPFLRKSSSTKLIMMSTASFGV